MKTRILLWMLSIITVSGYSQERTGKNQIEKEPGKEKQTEILVNNREFVFNANRAFPSGGSSIDLTTNRNFVKFSPGLIESYMPFFGRAYSAGYGDSGLHFKGKPEDFTVEKKRGNYRITVTVKGDNDIFRLFMTVSPRGGANLSIASNNRESMSYRGEIRAPGKGD